MFAPDYSPKDKKWLYLQIFSAKTIFQVAKCKKEL